MDRYTEQSSLFETWWTRDLEGAFQRWASQTPGKAIPATPETLRSFAEQTGLKPRWAR